MPNQTRQSSRFRLVQSGVLLLCLLAWVAVFDSKSLPAPPDGRGRGHPPVFLVTAAISLLALVGLSPVVRTGGWPQRGVALALGAFPLLTLIVVVSWMCGQGAHPWDAWFCSLVFSKRWLVDRVSP